MPRSYHLKPHLTRPYDHQYHRPLKAIWLDREWWFDNWRPLLAWITFTGCGDYERHRWWRRA